MTAWVRVLVPPMRWPCHARCVFGWYLSVAEIGLWQVASRIRRISHALQQHGHRPVDGITGAMPETVYPWGYRVAS